MNPALHTFIALLSLAFAAGMGYQIGLRHQQIKNFRAMYMMVLSDAAKLQQLFDNLDSNVEQDSA